MDSTVARLQQVLQYLQVPRDAVPAFRAALPQLADCLEALHSKLAASGVPAGTRICREPAPAFFQRGLPSFLHGSLRSIRLSDKYAECVPDETGIASTLHQLERGAALVRHIEDFISDIATWAIAGDAWRPSNESFALYPACDLEQKQAFWQGHQEQV